MIRYLIKTQNNSTNDLEFNEPYPSQVSLRTSESSLITGPSTISACHSPAV